MDPFVALLHGLTQRRVRYVTIGVWGANYFAHVGEAVFLTKDRDLFLPPDPANLLASWQASEEAGLELWCGREPLDQPRDHWLAQRVVQNRALTVAIGPKNLQVDLTLVMAAFEFEQVWAERRTFEDGGAEVHVARLRHIVDSKAAAARSKDRDFLDTHAEALERWIQRDSKPAS